MRVLTIIFLITLSACAVVEPSVFKNPQTGEIKECSSTSAGGFFPLINAWTAQHEIDTCSSAFARMGWVKQ